MLLFCFGSQSGLLIASVKILRKQFERLNTDPQYALKEESQLSFSTFRSAFLEAHDLPSNFLFDRYLSYCYNHFVLEVTSSCPSGPF